MTDHSQALAALLDSARRRRLAQIIAEQTGIALGAALAGAILLLLLGTQILDWYWLVVLFGGSLAAGLWGTVHRVPSRYRLAQIIDTRLQLHDTLSTALFFESGERAADRELLEYQRREAERLARNLEASSVFPMRMPKVMYAVGGIALVAFGMFAVRYGVTRSLDLKPSLVKIAFDTFFKPDERASADKKNPLQRRIEDQLKKLGINLGSPDTEAKQRDSTPESALNTMDAPDAGNTESSDNAQAKANNSASPNDHQPGDSEKGEKSERGSGAEDQNAGDQNAETAQGNSPEGKQDSAQKDAGDQNNDKSSMMDRMRDAMANLLNKLKMQPKGAESREQVAQDSKSGGKGPQSQSQKGSPTPGKSQANGADSPDPQGQQQGQGDRSQSAQGKAGDKSSDHQPSQDAKSGIGKDDGDKSAREAEQLAAMGKISQILGKRAQNVSGELMVEVAGGNQQLKTAYSGTVGKHAEAGGEISRDEVPLIYRDFVQQYFEQIRKTPPVPVAKAKAPDATPGKKPSKASE